MKPTKKQIQDFCKKIGITSEQFAGETQYSGSLYLDGLTAIPKGFNPTVGGHLYLNGLTAIPKGFNPTVGGSLYLNGLTAIPKGFNPTVGGYLFLNRLTANFTKLPSDFVFSWQNGKYILVDGIFTEVLGKRGNVYRVQKIGSKNITYLVSDGNGKWAHGETFKDAKADLVFKIGNRTTDDYKDLTLASSITFEDAITCYRVITGACSFGAKDFVNSRLKTKKREYTIAEVLELTKNEYGNKTFAGFFQQS